MILKVAYIEVFLPLNFDFGEILFEDFCHKINRCLLQVKKFEKYKFKNLKFGSVHQVFFEQLKTITGTDFWALQFKLFKFSYLYKNRQGPPKTNVSDLNHFLICPACIQQAKYTFDNP